MPRVHLLDGATAVAEAVAVPLAVARRVMTPSSSWMGWRRQRPRALQGGAARGAAPSSPGQGDKNEIPKRLRTLDKCDIMGLVFRPRTEAWEKEEAVDPNTLLLVGSFRTIDPH